MSDLEQNPESELERPDRGSFSRAAIFGAIAVVLVVIGGVLLASRGSHRVISGAILPLDAQASTLLLSDLAMSESTSISGGKSTFIDGHVRNTGDKIVNGIVVQVLFRNDVGLAPQIETLPLQLIRTHEPYVDTQPVSAAPMKAGEEREFRLIFENLNENWNIQIPEIHVVRVATK